MEFINTVLGTPLGYLMGLCRQICGGHYGPAILLFTLFTRILLFPLNIWVQRNAIKLVRMQPRLNEIAVRHAGRKDALAEAQMACYKEHKYRPLAGLLPMAIQILLVLGVIGVVNQSMHMGYDTTFLGLDLSEVPSLRLDALGMMPILAGLSALLLSACQNWVNVLQRGQGFWGRWGTAGFMTAFSLYFGYIVPAAVGLYWIAGNVVAVGFLYLVNWMIPPKKFIDYQALATSQEALKRSKAFEKTRRASPEQKRRAKADYKRFFAEDKPKQLVFYSEASGFYKYYRGVIEHVLANSEIMIHYVTSDPNDALLENHHERLVPYYIDDSRLIVLFMKLDADVAVMTTPDLQNYHLKRSLLRRDAEYIYMFHYPLSTHMVLPKGALDHYDTVFMVGEFQREEIRQWEKLNNLKEKKLVAVGYGVLEDMAVGYAGMDNSSFEKPKILIAPSWQDDNILDGPIDEILKQLLAHGWDVYVRPHPEYVKRFGSAMAAVVERWQEYDGGDLFFELDFSKTNSLYDSDLVITDWSGSAYEFAFVTGKPALFINTPPKVNNPEYERVSVAPLEVSLRERVGASVDLDKLETLPEVVTGLLDAKVEYIAKNQALYEETIANVGESARVGGGYLIDAVNKVS